MAWIRWVSALRNGPMAWLDWPAELSPRALASSWHGASLEIAARLSTSAAREELISASLRGDALELDYPGERVLVPLARVRPFELHEVALAHFDHPRGADPIFVIDSLTELAGLDERERERLRREILDSVLNLAQARLAAGLRELAARRVGSGRELGTSSDPRLIDPEHFVIAGHPTHPMARTRLGLRRADVVRYAPEQLASTPIHCVEVDERLVRVAGEWSLMARWLGEPAPGWVRLPVHPVQRRRLSRLFPELWAKGTIRPVDRPPVPSRSLLSLRTVALAPDRHLKLACNVHTTSVRRMVSPMSVANGPELSRVLRAIAERDPDAASLELMAEDAAAGLEPRRASVGARAAQLGAIARRGPEVAEGERAWVCAAIGERWPGCDERVIERACAGYPGDRRQRLLRLIDEWIARLVPPALRLLSLWGVALELHGQNTLVGVLDGRVTRFWIRDLGGIRVHRPRVEAACSREGIAAPRFAEDSFIVTDDLDEVRGKLEHSLFHSHFAQLFAAARECGLDEAEGWARLRRAIDRTYAGWLARPGLGPLVRAQLGEDLDALSRPQVRVKALLRMRLWERSSDYAYTRVDNVLARDQTRPKTDVSDEP